MGLAMLALQAMLLIVIMLMASSPHPAVSRSMLEDVLPLALQFRLIHIIQDLHAKLDIAQELVASALAEILSNDDS